MNIYSGTLILEQLMKLGGIKMVVIKIENKKGKELGALKINRTPEMNIDYETKNVEYVDESFDNIFGSNDDMISIRVNESQTFSSMNYINVSEVPDNCKDLVLELSAYNQLLEHYENRYLYDCYILIANYFGHIDYAKEFGYNKTHDEICLILFQNLLASFDAHNEKPNPFLDFVNRMRNKIDWSLQQRGYGR